MNCEKILKFVGMNVDYTKLSIGELDAIVTGELVHISLILELEINKFISEYFTYRGSRKEDFRAIILHRSCLTFQDKIDIVKAVLNKFYPKINKSEATKLLGKVEEFKSLRNAFSHGYASLTKPNEQVEVSIEMYTYSGKAKTIKITPENYKARYKEYYALFLELFKWRMKVMKIINAECLKK
jgi:hypothetical protein